MPHLISIIGLNVSKHVLPKQPVMVRRFEHSLNLVFNPSLSDMFWAWKNLFKTFSSKQKYLWLGPKIKPDNIPIFFLQAFHCVQPNIFKISLKKDQTVPNKWKRCRSRNCWKWVSFSWPKQKQEENQTKDAKEDNHLSFVY